WAEELERWLTMIYRPLFAEAGTKLGKAQYGAAQDGAAENEMTETPAMRRTRQAVEASIHVLQRMQKLQSTPDVASNAASAIELLADQLMQLRVGDESAEDAVTILGWLDLALEDAPAMVIVGV